MGVFKQGVQGVQKIPIVKIGFKFGIASVGVGFGVRSFCFCFLGVARCPRRSVDTIPIKAEKNKYNL